MADGCHVGKYSKCHNSPTNWPTVTQLGWSHPIMFSTSPPWCGCHGNGRWLATAHWTFCRNGHLEAERVNQFRRSLVHSSKLRPQWQSRDQILKFLKFKMADGRHVGQYWKYHNSPSNGSIGTHETWLVASKQHIAAKPFPWYLSLLLTAQWTFWFYGV